MIEKDNIPEIKDTLHEILVEHHDSYEKQSIKQGRDFLRFACPRCGDSDKKLSKKRGNFFFSSGYFHCYNCDWHTTILNFFDFYNREIDDVNIRINIRKTVNDYIEQGLTKNIDTISQKKIDELKKYAIPKQKIIDKLGLSPVYPTHPYVAKKKLHHRLNHLAFKRGNLYFFNMLDDENVLGFQTRTFNPKYESTMKYIKYPLGKIYDKFFPEDKPKGYEFDSIDKISLLYNLLTVQFERRVTVFEGASDSWLYPNSIGKSSVGLNDEFLDEHPNVRYFFDNDKAGYTKMAEKIKLGKKVFMWRKFISDFELWDYDLKDWADIIVLSSQIKKPLFREAEKYFTSEALDLIYV
jgi:hypothetical protein